MYGISVNTTGEKGFWTTQLISKTALANRPYFMLKTASYWGPLATTQAPKVKTRWWKR
jgi:hypothetical protein